MTFALPFVIFTYTNMTFTLRFVLSVYANRTSCYHFVLFTYANRTNLLKNDEKSVKDAYFSCVIRKYFLYLRRTKVQM